MQRRVKFHSYTLCWCRSSIYTFNMWPWPFPSFAPLSYLFHEPLSINRLQNIGHAISYLHISGIRQNITWIVNSCVHAYLPYASNDDPKLVASFLTYKATIWKMFVIIRYKLFYYIIKGIVNAQYYTVLLI